MYKKSNSKGFSLFELLVVIVIISILSGLGFVAFKTTLDRTKESLAISNLINIDEFVRTELFVINHNILENAPQIKTGSIQYVPIPMDLGSKVEYVVQDLHTPAWGNMSVIGG